MNASTVESNLTKRQQLMWIEYELDPDDPANNMVMTFTISGKLDPSSFREAFELVVHESDAMRAVFESISGIPMQRFSNDLNVAHETISLSENELTSWIDSRCIIPFDLGVRAFDSVLIQVAPERFVWYLSQHHIITDGWSFYLIYSRVAEAYQNLFEPGPKATTRPSFSFYLTHESKYRESKAQFNDADYWDQLLAKPLSPITFNGHANTGDAHRFLRVTHVLDRATTKKLWDTASRHEVRSLTSDLSNLVALCTVLLAYLHRVTGLFDIAIAIPVLNRGSKKLREIVGPLLEVGILRVELEHEETFVSLAEKLETEIFKTLKHVRYGVGNPIHERAYEVMLNFNTAAFPDFCGYPIRTYSMSAQNSSAYVNRKTRRRQATESLVMQVSDFDDAGRLSLDFDFNERVFDHESSARAVAQFIKILNAFIKDIKDSIHQVSLVSDDERMLFQMVNSTEQAFHRDRSVAELFLDQVQRSPDAIAVTDGSRSITYEELDVKANKLANYLGNLGVEQNCRVGLCIERSVQMFIGLLGILKSGASYIPLDPEYPKKRLEFMIGDSHPKLVLTQSSLVELLPEDTQTVLLDSGWDDIESASSAKPSVETDDQAEMYVMYTSGSTGRPKGVIAQHRATVNRLSWMWNAFPFTEGEKACQKTAISFVDSVWEIFGPLLQGVPSIIVDKQAVRDPHALVQELSTSQVTRIVLVPSLLSAMLTELPDIAMRLPKLQQWIVSGEALSKDLYRKFDELVPQGELLNLYGSTEVAGDATFFLSRETEHTAFVPIGRPIANIQVYVLDRFRNPCPVGVTGELYIGGEAVAQGYVNQPTITNERFLEGQIASAPGARVFRTGDLCRFLPDGNLDFVGREDGQVKLRGQRIELREIESVLREHAAVRDAVVSVWGDDPVKQRLVAYVVPAMESGLDEHEARDSLRKRLPEFMIPSNWVFLHDLPKLPNGKIDKQSLPSPHDNAYSRDTAASEPADDLETYISEVWKSVIGLDRVGMNDDYFDLGGNSLLAIQLLKELNQEYDLDFRLGDLFENPTVRKLAKLVGRDRVSDRPATILLHRGSAALPLFCICGVHIYHELAQCLGDDRPVYGIIIPEESGVFDERLASGNEPTLPDAEELASAYLRAIRSVQPQGPYCLAGLSYGGILAYEIAQQLIRDDDEVGILVLLDTIMPTGIRLKPISWFVSRLRSIVFWHPVKNWRTGSEESPRLKKWTNRARRFVNTSRSVETSYDEHDLSLRRWKRFTASMELYENRIQPYPGDVVLIEAKQRHGFDGYEFGLVSYWSNLVEGTIQAFDIPADHVDILKKPHVQKVANRLKPLLDAVTRPVEADLEKQKNLTDSRFAQSG